MFIRLYKRVLSPKRLKLKEICRKRYKHDHAVAVRPEPKYPTIFDTTSEGYAKYQRQLWYDSVKALPTVEQKLYEITCNHSYYERTYKVSSCSPTYLGVPFQRYITRTHLIQGLPQSYEARNVEEELSAVKEELSDLLSISFSNLWRQSKLSSLSDFTKEKLCGAKLSNGIISLISKAFADRNSHLLERAFDTQPRLNSYWFHGDFISKKDKVNHKNLCFQFSDDAAYTVRANKPLPPIVPIDDPLCATSEVIDYNYHPSACGIPYNRQYILSLPGFWPGDTRDFPVLQIYTSDMMDYLVGKLEYFDLKTIEDGFGVMSSFGWINALATYQGFTAYHDVTYPIVGQTILTNGQDWTFFVYQLNTMCFHSDLDKKDRRNLCWTSGKMRLFETIENGELKGVNEDVFKNLLKFVLAEPDLREGLNLKPYLGIETRSEEDILQMKEDGRKMYRNFKNLCRPSLYNEIPLWHHVYKRNKDAPPSPWIKLE